ELLRRRGVEPRDASEVVNLDPFRDGMLTARAGSMRDRRNARERGERIAIVDKRLGTVRQRRPGSHLVAALEGGQQWICRIERECITDEHSLAGNVRARGAGGLHEQGAEVALDGVRIGARQPAPRSFEPGFLWVLIEDLARMDLSDEDAGRPAS